MKAGRRAESGQMTVELAVALPALIVVIVVAVNALQFFSVCASFDRVAHDEVRVIAVSPAYGQGVDQSLAKLDDALHSAFLGYDNLDISVAYGEAALDFDEFTATVDFYPTLFGRGLRTEVFGVPLPHLTHRSRFVVDVYKPGVMV